MPLATLLPLIGSMLTQAIGLFAGDDDKLTKIANIASGALGRLPGMIDAVENLFDGKTDLTAQDFDALIAKIDQNTVTIDELNQEAQQRDA